jgi:hypothetical protein
MSDTRARDWDVLHSQLAAVRLLTENGEYSQAYAELDKAVESAENLQKHETNGGHVSGGHVSESSEAKAVINGLAGHLELADRIENWRNNDDEGYGSAIELLCKAEEALRVEICICAAIQFTDGRIVRGHRHDACFRTAEGWTPRPDIKGHIQGFITSRNRLVDRQEGARLQNAAGIISAHTQKPIIDELFSEDLYFDSHDHVAWSTPYKDPID